MSFARNGGNVQSLRCVLAQRIAKLWIAERLLGSHQDGRSGLRFRLVHREERGQSLSGMHGGSQYAQVRREPVAREQVDRFHIGTHCAKHFAVARPAAGGDQGKGDRGSEDPRNTPQTQSAVQQ